MKPRIVFLVLPFFLLLLNSGSAVADWSGPQEIISGKWGAGAGEFGLRTEGGFSASPSVEAITPDKNVIVSDTVNKKQMVFNVEGRLINELKWDSAQGKEGKAVAPLSQKDRQADTVNSMKASATTYRITVVFNDRNVVIVSDHDFRSAVRDVSGFVYGTAPNRVVRFDKNGKKTAEILVPNAHEELIPVPGLRAPRGVYIEYGEPVIAPNGDVYLWKKSDEKYSILKWTWQ